MTGALDGVRVVEMTSVVLGPYACQMLGDLGADIIKIEPLNGDTNRNLGPYRNSKDMSALYLSCNRNKRSVSINLKSESGKNAAMQIIKTADVVVHNFRPQAMRRLGIDYEDVKAINPEIIYCGTYGYSKKGPYGSKGALDDSIQAASGIAILQSMTEGDPRYLPTIICDKTTGLMVVQAVLAALFHKQRTGEGQQLEVPMFETMVSFTMVEHLWGQAFRPPLGKAGYTRLMAKHRRPYKTKDGQYLAVLPYWDNHWKTFCEISERKELIKDDRFIDMASRLKNIDESYRLTSEIISSRTRDQWLDLLGDTKIPFMVVNSLDDLIEDPQLVASEFWQEFDHPTEGQIRLAGSPINFDKTPTSIRYLAPRLGEHTVEVLSEAGFDKETIEDLLKNGEIRSFNSSTGN
ncbi:MAG: CoA transferase [Porticoccaceae bacterium]|nr:CoA transferase [Porticoccaceae bacterium]